MSRMLTAVREAVMGLGPAEPAAPMAEPAPFIEIGGPGGPISSMPLPPKPAPVAPAPKAAVPETVPFPRLVEPESSFVSVAFHDLSGKPKSAARLDEPSADLVALHFPEHPVSLEYKALSDEIASQLNAGQPHAVLFTAAAPDAGTTTVVLNLAITLARDPSTRVLVVDANIARPGISTRLCVKDRPGLVETLAGQLPLAWAIQPAPVPNLQVLAAGVPTSATPALIAESLPKMFAQLREWFDWVLIDGGVWGEIPERDAACPGADAVYLVTREADTTRTEFDGLRGWVKQLGGLLRGFVTTRL